MQATPSASAGSPPTRRGSWCLSLPGLARRPGARVGSNALGLSAPELPQQFAVPPREGWPWVYWFWLDGNILHEDITADLEAMQRVDIGGVLIMEAANDRCRPR